MYLVESVFAAILPMLVYLYIIWKNDKFEPEPARLVLLSFGYGAIGAVILTLLMSAIFSASLYLFYSEETNSFLGAVMVAPVVEEIAKGLFLIVLLKNINFDNVTDGLVYGGAIGLGFGMTENFFYFFAQDTGLYTWVMVVIVRSLFSAVMHCISTATLGAFMAMYKFSLNKAKKTLPVTGLALAMLIHFLWNFNLSFENTVIFAFFIMIAIITIFILMFRVSIKHEKRLILSELTEEVENGLFPEGHPEVITSSGETALYGIESCHSERYIQSAVKLAFRKTQLRNSNDKNKLIYETEIVKHRKIIKEILTNGDDE
ncbi:MAG: PrsW family intramembrane metalloprotease [Rhodothermaceae bacterium]